MSYFIAESFNVPDRYPEVFGLVSSVLFPKLYLLTRPDLTHPAVDFVRFRRRSEKALVSHLYKDAIGRRVAPALGP